MEEFINAILCLFVFLLVGCASSPTPPVNQPAPASLPQAAASPANKPTEKPPIEIKEEITQKAQQFDKFLQDQLKPEEVGQLKDDCRLSPADNPFCYGILNRERLDGLLNKEVKPAGRGYSNLRVKFSHGTIKNWLELRFASVNASLRALSVLRLSELMKVSRRAASEGRCPNNIAIAAASMREDYLPDHSTPTEVAKLYQRGGDCLVKDPEQRSALLTRAGLFYFLSKKYKEAEKLFTKASTLPAMYVGRSLYWLYRTEGILHQEKKEKETLDELKNRYPFSFHALVALTALGQDPGDILLKTKGPWLTRSQQNPKVNPLIEEVEILSELHLKESTSKVLEWAMAESQVAEPELRLYLAGLQPDEGDYRSKISLLSDVLYKNPTLISKESMEMYFPKVLFPIFEKNSQGIDPYLLISVARQESAFNPRAISSADARGLLQLNVATGIRYQNNPPPDLMDPDQNIQIAAKYLTDLLKKVNGQIHLALAAYNAGESHVSAWTTRYSADQPILFIDLIPYRETRDYVASVLRNYYWYRRIHKPEESTVTKELSSLTKAR